MATIIEITDSKLDCLSECTEKILRYSGKLMSTIEELQGSKYGMKRHEDEDDEYEKRYHERKYNKGYSRYY